MNLTLNFVDPKVIGQRLIETENQSSGYEEDFEKAAYFRDQIARSTKKCRKTKILTNQDTQSSARKPLNTSLSRKPISWWELKEKEQSQLIHPRTFQAHVIGQDEAVDGLPKAIISQSIIGLGTPNYWPIRLPLCQLQLVSMNEELSKQPPLSSLALLTAWFALIGDTWRKTQCDISVSEPLQAMYSSGQLTEKVRRNPYSLILSRWGRESPPECHACSSSLGRWSFDRWKGRLRLAFKDAIIIMTSNAGTGKAETSVGLGCSWGSNQLCSCWLSTS